MDVCLRVLNESSKSRFDSYSVRNSVLIISHVTFRDCRVHILFDNLSRNSCIFVCISPKVPRNRGSFVRSQLFTKKTKRTRDHSIQWNVQNVKTRKAREKSYFV